MAVSFPNLAGLFFLKGNNVCEKMAEAKMEGWNFFLLLCERIMGRKGEEILGTTAGIWVFLFQISLAIFPCNFELNWRRHVNTKMRV